ncbi:NAD(P)H-dependent oxidoreductase [Ichthyenterobacterium magnum]|uniref:Nitroreductase n=1 Tax=Ichthyenterobacterium magnum TaxID=1230530 RepID=A0A420DKX2_9FLAO|nr:NAD(P)H-dependent oxidoreductase [Ichthyenterobacterium magnum]RKE94904.1 nitroreductase [Ichthyenterobacterium magnum]
MDIVEALHWRYATKTFDSNAILEQKKIETLKNVFNLTATSYGLQPIKLLILKNKALQKKLVKHSMDQEQVAQASHVLVFCIETTIDKIYVKSYFNLIKEIRNTPDEILEPFKSFLIDDFKKMSQDSIEKWATKQAYLAMGNLLTVCAVEKIDSCPMEGFTPTKYDELLKLTEKGLKSVLVMPIGYRAKDDMFASFKKVRKNIDDIIIEM